MSIVVPAGREAKSGAVERPAAGRFGGGTGGDREVVVLDAESCEQLWCGPAERLGREWPEHQPHNAENG